MCNELANINSTIRKFRIVETELRKKTNTVNEPIQLSGKTGQLKTTLILTAFSNRISTNTLKKCWEGKQ